MVRQHILRILLVFAKEACQLGLQGVWGVDHIRSVVKEFLRRLTIDIEYGAAFGIRTMTSNWNGSILTEAQRAFEQSGEWAEYDALLLKVAKAQALISKQAVARMEPLKSGHASDPAHGEGQQVRPQPAIVTNGSKTDQHAAGEEKPRSKPGPIAKMDYHRAIAAIVEPYGDDWREESNLEKIAEELDRDKNKTPPRKSWATRTAKRAAARSWGRMVGIEANMVRKAIAPSLKMAAKDTANRNSS